MPFCPCWAMRGAWCVDVAKRAVGEEAVRRGVFGAPTFFVGKEMFFGKEQLREVEEMVSGK